MSRKKSNPQHDVQKTRMIHIRVLDDDHRRMRLLVADLDTTIQDWVEAQIIKGLKGMKIERAL